MAEARAKLADYLRVATDEVVYFPNPTTAINMVVRSLNLKPGIVDGAHAPGQLPLNLTEVGADFYTGACHKWLCGPKGSAFLYARREMQTRLEPLVVSWGWESELPSDSQFIDWHEWQGTRDVAAFLATPAVMEFQAMHNWDAVRAESHALVSETRRRINDLTGFAPICPDSLDWFGQMAAVRLPRVDVKWLKESLYNDYHIEVPVFKWNDETLMRLSFQGYNSRADADALIEALKRLL